MFRFLLAAGLVALGEGCATNCDYTPDWVDWEGFDDDGFAIRCECETDSMATCYWQPGREPGACGGWIENSDLDLEGDAIALEDGDEDYELTSGQLEDLREACAG